MSSSESRVAEALKESGVPSQQAAHQSRVLLPADASWSAEVRVAIATDRAAILRCLLEIRLEELSDHSADTGHDGLILNGDWFDLGDLLNLLAPESP